jgi:hypothetical protein
MNLTETTEKVLRLDRSQLAGILEARGHTVHVRASDVCLQLAVALGIDNGEIQLVEVERHLR